MEEFRPRGAPLEYWFIKLRSGDLAFLVDWIVRRGSGEAEVRISLFVRGAGRVLRTWADVWWEGAAAVHVNECALTPGCASGAVNDVRWDLTCDPGEARLDPVPLPAKLLHPFDLQLAGRPRTRFTGTIEVAGEAFTLIDAHGTLNHYWGRRLPDSWVWVSADGLGDGNGVVEAALIRTRLWGHGRRGLIGGYAMIDDGSRRTQILAPTYGHLSVDGTQECFEINAWSRGRKVALTARAPRSAYNDLGEGIRQTLLGDVAVDGLGSSRRSAGLEARGNLLTPG